MSQSGDIKIKVLPRNGKKTEADTSKPTPKPPRMIIYVGTLCIMALTGLWIWPQIHAKTSRRLAKVESASQASLDTRAEDSVKRHEEDSVIRRKMMMRTRELENMQFKNALNEPNATRVAEMPEARSYGVQIDAEDSSDRLYEDLHGDPVHESDTLPDDKINARLATRKWVNEQEREEKITFIRNFIRSAYDRGYEVEIDQNLVVVGVHKINTTKKLNINQVIDRITSQNL